MKLTLYLCQTRYYSYFYTYCKICQMTWCLDVLLTSPLYIFKDLEIWEIKLGDYRREYILTSVIPKLYFCLCGRVDSAADSEVILINKNSAFVQIFRGARDLNENHWHFIVRSKAHRAEDRSQNNENINERYTACACLVNNWQWLHSKLWLLPAVTQVKLSKLPSRKKHGFQ